MNKNELKELIKQVIAEETEYQKLFKTMLDRSGKDINSMSDEEKKKFFNAVDKAYKAKSEGKLVDSKKKSELNEGWELLGNPVIAYLTVSLVGLLFTYIGGKIHGLLSKKEYEEAVKYCIDVLQNDDGFIKKAAQIIAKSDKLDKLTAEKIVDLPVVEKLTREYIQKFHSTPSGGKLLSQDWLQMELRDVIIKAWNSGDMKNIIINKIKNI